MVSNLCVQGRSAYSWLSFCCLQVLQQYLPFHSLPNDTAFLSRCWFYKLSALGVLKEAGLYPLMLLSLSVCRIFHSSSYSVTFFLPALLSLSPFSSLKLWSLTLSHYVPLLSSAHIQTLHFPLRLSLPVATLHRLLFFFFCLIHFQIFH